MARGPSSCYRPAKIEPEEATISSTIFIGNLSFETTEEELRTVLTSTPRLARIDNPSEYATSPFLHGFAPPVYLECLTPTDARALLSPAGFSNEDVETVIARTGCHPFLLQLIGSRLLKSRDLNATLDQVAGDKMLASFFAVDFQMLSWPEDGLLAAVAREGPRTSAQLGAALSASEESLAGPLHALSMLGYLQRQEDRWRMGNWFYEQWLRRGAHGPGEPDGL